ncbi:MAG: divalent-cation tolerance protein CutA [Acidobacteriia bacterium]|nr:divalent-cation tolerance protein CutA [Terriglobia bacterium]
MNAILVLTTVDNPELAHRIATALVEAGEAACVSIVPGIRSIYRWEGKIRNEGELLLIIKSVAGRYEDVRSRIRQLHSYRVPEVIALTLTSGDHEYLHWLGAQVGMTDD